MADEKHPLMLSYLNRKMNENTLDSLSLKKMNTIRILRNNEKKKKN